MRGGGSLSVVLLVCLAIGLMLGALAGAVVPRAQDGRLADLERRQLEASRQANADESQGAALAEENAQLESEIAAMLRLVASEPEAAARLWAAYDEAHSETRALARLVRRLAQRASDAYGTWPAAIRERTEYNVLLRELLAAEERGVRDAGDAEEGR